MSCNLPLLRYKVVYHLLRPLLIFVHVCSLLGQSWTEVVFFFFILHSEIPIIFGFTLRLFIKEESSSQWYESDMFRCK